MVHFFVEEKQPILLTLNVMLYLFAQLEGNNIYYVLCFVFEKIIVLLFRNPTHYVFVQDTPGDIGLYLAERIEPRPEKPRGSVHSLRRGSFDVRSIGSDNMRRTSLAKLHAMPLEAPITKVTHSRVL